METIYQLPDKFLRGKKFFGPHDFPSLIFQLVIFLKMFPIADQQLIQPSAFLLPAIDTTVDSDYSKGFLNWRINPHRGSINQSSASRECSH